MKKSLWFLALLAISIVVMLLSKSRPHMTIPDVDGNKSGTTEVAGSGSIDEHSPEPKKKPAASPEMTKAEKFRRIDALKKAMTPQAIAELQTFLESDDSFIQVYTLQALAESGPIEALPRVADIVQSSRDDLIVPPAAMTLGAIGKNLTTDAEKELAIDALKVGISLHRDGSSPESRTNIYSMLEAAGNISGQQSGEFLLAEISNLSGNPLAQYTAVESLGRIAYKPALGGLTRFRKEILAKGPGGWSSKETFEDMVKLLNATIEALSM